MDKNKPISRINQVFNANDNITNADSDAGSKAGSEVGLKASSKTDFNYNHAKKADLVFEVLAIEADKSQISKKKSIKTTSLI